MLAHRWFLGTLLLLLAAFGLLAGCGSQPRENYTSPGGQSVRFQSVGQASWYGPGFAGKRTASGEIFDPSDLTAAHAVLPFDTRVRVTDVGSGRSVVVRINDRFPNTKGRVIDLSRAAFALLAPLERGVIDVRLEPLG